MYNGGAWSFLDPIAAWNK